jgi:hypothetical protein
VALLPTVFIGTAKKGDVAADMVVAGAAKRGRNCCQRWSSMLPLNSGVAADRGGPRAKITRCHFTSHTTF